MTTEISCSFRHSVREVDGQELATCGLLQKLLSENLNEPISACQVKRDACVACSQSIPMTGDLIGQPFASILSNACELTRNRRTSPPEDSGRVLTLGQLAEDAILSPDFVRRGTTCDVIVWCKTLTDRTQRSIDSVLGQTNAETTVHIVIAGRSEDQVGRRYDEVLGYYESRYDVRVHRMPQFDSPLRALHELAPRLRSEFVALQHSDGFSLPNRIDSAVRELRRLGADFIGSPLRTPSGQMEVPKSPGARFEPSIPWPTWVFRRARFIDLGGVADREEDADVELLFRAHACGVKIVSLPWASVQLEQDWAPATCGKAPLYSKQYGTLRHHAIGFPSTITACDVVLPVFGQLEYVRPAIESVIDQYDAETIVHLIDDRGPEDVTDLFRFWGSHPRVRLYRNQTNLGQYTSFNNVSEYLETDLVAVQDGDDISLPNRLSVGGNLLALTDGDYFAATMEQFGAAEELPDRCSSYPNRTTSPYFAMNPTACFRVSMFRSLGGYADCGAHARNRCGLDTEFMNRAYYCERRFAISTSVVTRRRVHSEAATQRSDTGFGSRLRDQAISESHRRIELMKSGQFDPRFFGGLGNHRGLTERLKLGLR